MVQERLQKVLANAGIASRRVCEKLILNGEVSVNGKIVKELGMKVDPFKDNISYKGEKVKTEEKKYILLNKPSGYVTTVKDNFERKTVMHLLKGINERVYPVGRLDYDTEGLLILSNDGVFTYKLTHPKHCINKTYLALVKGIPSKDLIKKLEKGIELEDGLTASAKARIVENYNDSVLVELTIHEGRNRQVKRMLSSIGHPVLKLKRSKIGNLQVGNLKVGEYRYLSKKEIDFLLNEK